MMRKITMISCQQVLVLNMMFLAYTISSQSNDHRKFPEGFLFGAATSSYQIEGAWDADGRGLGMWDRFIHEDPSRIKNEENGDVACDSYHKYKEDIKLAAQMGLHHYRFSISWPRVLPTGHENKINGKGIEYYQNIVDECLKYGIQPMATLYHWDLPASIQDLGGFMTPNLVPLFVKYARIVIASLPKVAYWVTMNEPKQVCTLGYGKGVHAPGITITGFGEYQCAYVLVKAHAAAYRMYKEEFPHYTAPMSIVVDGEWNEPATNETEDIEAAQRRNQFEVGLYANPIYNGDWPQEVKDRIAKRSGMENFQQSRLPKFSPEEIDFINGTWDYFGLNIYETHLVADVEEATGESYPSYENDIRAGLSNDPSWKISPCRFNIVPWGARKMLKWVKDTYKNPPTIITENGVCDDGKTLIDKDRIMYLQDYLSAILDAIYEDGVDVYGYTVWSLIDSFEWLNGYRTPFGLYHVDFEDPERKRTAKKSVEYFKDICSTGELPRREDMKLYFD